MSTFVRLLQFLSVFDYFSLLGPFLFVSVPLGIFMISVLLCPHVKSFMDLRVLGTLRFFFKFDWFISFFNLFFRRGTKRSKRNI